MAKEKKKKAIVLLSAGLDSTVNVYAAAEKFEIVKALTFDYGQKSASKEVEHSKWIAQELNLDHEVIELPWLKAITTTSLVNQAASVPQGDEIEIDDIEVSLESAAKVWVPNRNGVFLNVAASYADALNAHYVVPGFNYEEAQTFPDNSKEFLEVVTESLSYSTSNTVKAHCFTIDLNKNEIVALGKKLKVPFRMVWSCYHAWDVHCGQCESCLRLKRALKSEGVLGEIKMD